MDYRKYMKRMNLAIGKAADKIDEGPWWNSTMKELNQMSIESANELQHDIDLTLARENKQIKYLKPSRNGQPEYMLDLFEAPPMRLLAMGIVLAGWLGWVMRDKQPNENDVFSSNNCSRIIKDAFDYGVSLRAKGDKLEDC